MKLLKTKIFSLAVMDNIFPDNHNSFKWMKFLLTIIVRVTNSNKWINNHNKNNILNSC